MLRAFIVRPFGTRNGIDFDAVEAQLIQPAFARLDIQGGTTGKILESGNIREDMFQQLLVADLVVADVSIHNANVFYELGIRHALQPKRTFLLRARQTKPRSETGDDEIPFDLRTDRYLEYEAANPAATLTVFMDALAQTLAADRQDSPVFRLLPNLQPQERSRFLLVPQKFREDVALASKMRQIGKLGLLGLEAKDSAWASEGLRLVGREQFSAEAYTAARGSWEPICDLDPLDTEANLTLATIYQRLHDLNASDQALQRVLTARQTHPVTRAEALSVLARNIKERWHEGFDQFEGERLRRYSLQSPFLTQAVEKYTQGFQQDLSNHYAGINALSLLTIRVELAKGLPDEWQARYQAPADAMRDLQALEQQRQMLAGAVGFSLNAAKQRQVSGSDDRWLEIGIADYTFLTADRASSVRFAYESALAGATLFQVNSARIQLQLFWRLNLFMDKLRAAFEAFPPDTQAPAAKATPPERVVLFAGHMMDQPGRTPPRFPASCESTARAAIRDALRKELQRTPGTLIGIASAANGSDILFHEVCDELGVTHRILLPLPVDLFRNESVSPAGPAWEERFDALLRRFPAPPFLANSEALPSWLGVQPKYNAWQRANLWIMQEALATGAAHLTLLALWDGTTGDGPGGTEHMIRVAKQSGAAVVILRTDQLFDRYLAAASAP
jgi:hypothetical protein